jgi:hypothetical protein
VVDAVIALEHVDAAEPDEAHAPRALQARQQVEGQVLHVVHFARHQGGGARRLVRHHAQRDVGQVNALAAG